MLLRVADLVLDVRTRKATRGAARIDLTTRGFELLEYLVRPQTVRVTQ